jgi:two-component system cell cycle response regulator DivK
MTRILIIEDDGPSLMLAKYLFEAAGFEIVSATTGTEGVEQALRHAPDLILCDLQLPEFTGYEVLSRLMQCPEWRAVPVVAVTAFSMTGDREKVLAAGFAGYISKPIMPTTFVCQVEEFLPPAVGTRSS